MERIYVDFNTVIQDAERGDRVTLGTDNELREGKLPKVRPGERVIAFDDEMEVEGVVEHDGAFWVATLDWPTLTRCASVS